MRGRRDPQAAMLAFVDMEERVPKDHPIRSIKAVADEALERLSPEKGELLDAILGVYRAGQVARVFQTTRRPQDQPPVVVLAFFRYGEETPVFVSEMEFEMVEWLAKRLQMVVES